MALEDVFDGRVVDFAVKANGPLAVFRLEPIEEMSVRILPFSKYRVRISMEYVEDAFAGENEWDAPVSGQELEAVESFEVTEPVVEETVVVSDEFDLVKAIDEMYAGRVAEDYNHYEVDSLLTDL